MDQTNPFDSITLDSVAKDERIFAKSHWFSIFLIFLVSAAIFWIAWDIKIFQIDIVGVFVLLAGFGFIGGKARSMFMKQVGIALNYEYSASASMSTVTGDLFNIGHSQNISNVLQGTYVTFPSRIYNFATTVGSGKNRHTYSYTVFEITYQYNLPHLLLLAHQNMLADLGGGTPKLVGGKGLSLEGDFNKYFTLYVENSFELEALEIFTPETMNSFIQKDRQVNFELCDHKLYVFQRGLASNKEQMKAMFEMGTFVSQNILPHLSAVSGDVGAMESEIAK